MEALRYQIDRLQAALQSLDMAATVATLSSRDVARLQSALAHTEALLRRLPSTTTSTTTATTAAAGHGQRGTQQKQQHAADTLASVSAQTGASVDDVRRWNPSLAHIPEDTALPTNTFLKLRLPTPLTVEVVGAAPVTSRKISGTVDGADGATHRKGPPHSQPAQPLPPALPSAAQPTPSSASQSRAPKATTQTPDASAASSPVRPASAGTSMDGGSPIPQPGESPMTRGRSPDYARYVGSGGSVHYDRSGSWAPESSSMNASAASAPPPCAPMLAVPTTAPTANTSAGGAASRNATAPPQQQQQQQWLLAESPSPTDAMTSLVNSPPSPMPQPPPSQSLSSRQRHGGGKTVGSPPPSRRPKASRSKLAAATVPREGEKPVASGTPPPVDSVPQAKHSDEGSGIAPSNNSGINGGGDGGGGVSPSPTSSSNSAPRKSAVVVPGPGGCGGVAIITSTQRRGRTGSRSPSSQPRSPSTAMHQPALPAERELSLPLSTSKPHDGGDAATASGGEGEDGGVPLSQQQRSERRFRHPSLSQPRATSSPLSAVSAPSSASASPPAPSGTQRAISEAGPNRLAPSPVEARTLFHSDDGVGAEGGGEVAEGFVPRGDPDTDCGGAADEGGATSTERGDTVSISVSKERAGSGEPSVPPHAQQRQQQQQQVVVQRGGQPRTASSSPPRRCPTVSDASLSPEGGATRKGMTAVTAADGAVSSLSPANDDSAVGDKEGGSDGDEEDEEDQLRDAAPTPCSAVPSSLTGLYYAGNPAPTVHCPKQENGAEGEGERGVAAPPLPPQSQKGAATASSALEGNGTAVASPPPAALPSQDISMATSSTFVSEPPSFQETSPVPQRQRPQATTPSSSRVAGVGEMESEPVLYDLEGEGTPPPPPPQSGVTRTPPQSSPPPVLSPSPKPAGRIRMLEQQRQRSNSAPSITHAHESDRERVDGSPPTGGTKEGGDGASTLEEEEDQTSTAYTGQGDDDSIDDDEEYDTIAGISQSYGVSVEEVVKWNPYLAVYGPDDALPPDLPIVLPVPAAAAAEAEAEGEERNAFGKEDHTPEVSVEPWVEGTPSPTPSRPVPR